MADWSVTQGRVTFGWNDGKATTNETALYMVTNYPDLGYMRRDLSPFTPLPMTDPRTDENTWAEWVNVITGEGEQDRKIVGNPPFWKPAPGTIY